MIWEAALPPLRSRVVKIEEKALRQPSLDENDTQVESQPSTVPTKQMAMRSDHPPPLLLFVNRESYSLASKYYQRKFESQCPRPAKNKDSNNISDDVQQEEIEVHGVYFSNQLDTLCISWTGFLNVHGLPSSQTVALIQNPQYQSLRAAMKGVENLAVVNASCNLSKLPVFNLYGPYRYAPFDSYEHLIAQLLHVCGGSVKHLTIVVRDYSAFDRLEAARPRNEYPREMALVDLADVEEARRIVGDGFVQWPVPCWNARYDPHVRVGGAHIVGKDQPRKLPYYRDMATVDVRRLEACKEKMMRLGVDVKWVVPEIVYKVGISAFEMDFKDWVDGLRKKNASKHGAF